MTWNLTWLENLFGFTKLDRVINLCKKCNAFAVLEVHAALNGQTQDWHVD